MAKWKCEICGNEFDNFHAQGFDNKIYCPLCYFKKENQELKKQLEEYQLQNIDLRADIMIQKKAFPNKLIKDKTFYDLYNMPTYEDLLHQQKEFTSYLEKIIEELECDDVDDEEMKGYLIQRIDTFKEILKKYKS